MRLISAEILRARSRRATWIILVGLVGIILFYLGTNFLSNKMPSDAQIAEQRTYYEESLADWNAYHQEWYDDCIEGAESEGVSADDWGCKDYLVPPSFDNFVWTPPGFTERVADDASGLLMLAAVFMLLLGATLTAAEYSTGSLGNWLTFAPRRSRVFFSKLAAPAVFALMAAVLTAAVAILGTAAWTELRGLPSPEPLDVTQLTGVVLRSTGIVVASGAIGATLGLLLRHTAAVIGVVGGYAFVVEMLFLGQFWGSPASRWILSTNLMAIANGKQSYYINVCSWNQAEMYQECVQVEKFVTAAQATTYLGILSLVLVVVTWLVFRRRDVH